MAQPQSLTHNLQQRNKKTRAALPTSAQTPVHPDERQLALRLEESKARLRHATAEIDQRLKLVTWAAGAGLAVLRLRSKNRQDKKKKDMRERSRGRRWFW